MWKRQVMWLILGLALAAAPAAALAAPVGQFLQAEGEVDLSKAGKAPAVAVKPNDPVEVGDVVRTKSNGRAQIRFVDDSVLTIAPDSRVAVEEYLFDPAKGDRKATLEVFRGLVHTTVNKVDPNKPPDFFLKTHTAVMGVRGTRWFTKLLPTVTEVYTEGSRLEVRCLKFPDKMVLLKDLQFTQVGENFILPAVDITREAIEGLRHSSRFLSQACLSGISGESAEGLLLASLCGGLCLANGGLGAVHGLAGPLGGMVEAPHGAICAALLAPVMEANLNVLAGRAPEHPAHARYRQIAEIVTGKQGVDASQGVTWVCELCHVLEVPRLSRWGLSEDEIPSLVQKAKAASSMRGNPVQLSESELINVAKKAL